MNSKLFLSAAIGLGLIAPAQARPMLNGHPCVVGATDPTSGFPLGFSVCWSPNERISMARPETLDLLARPSTYNFPNHSAAVAYVVLGFRPEHDARVFLTQGRLYIMADPLGDPKETPRVMAEQMALADLLQKELGDVIAGTRKRNSLWRGFVRNGQIGFEPMGGGGALTARPAANTELFDSLRRLYADDNGYDFKIKLRELPDEDAAGLLAYLDDRVQLNHPGVSTPDIDTLSEEARDVLRDVESRYKNLAMENLLASQEINPIPDGLSRIYCYSLETASFEFQPDLTSGFLDALLQAPGSDDRDLAKLSGCAEGIGLTVVGNSLFQVPFDLRDEEDMP